MELLTLGIRYLWEPFTLLGRHLTFNEHQNERLFKADCSHWGVAVYKWEGFLTQGEHAGNKGVLIGETGDLRHRIKQYISGTQQSGNKYWREQFLTKGDIRLWILHLGEGKIQKSVGDSEVLRSTNLSTKNFRQLVEQLLVLHEVQDIKAKKWIVNKWE